MRIASIAFGTRGDVQPALALGMGLQRQGHQVRMIVGSDFAEESRKCGLEASTAALDFQEMLSAELGHKYFKSGSDATMIAFMRAMRSIFTAHGEALIDAVYRACVDFKAEAVLGSYTSDVYAMAVAEKLGIPHLSTTLQPAPVATRNGPVMMTAPLPNRDSLFNLAFHKVGIQPVAWRIMKGPVNDYRRDVLGLPTWRGRTVVAKLRRTPYITGYSEHLVPRAKDWPDNVHVAGFWMLDNDLGFRAPDDLLKFIDDGEPPVFIGFGSTTMSDSPGLTRLLIDAVTAGGRRAIIQSGWAGLGQTELPGNIYHLTSYVPYGDLFPRVAAVVHHSGAGTTSWVLRAGVPSIGVPHAGDQPFWARRVAALGVGPRPVPASKLTADGLAHAIRQATTDPAMRERAAALGAKVRAEDGVGTAVALIERYLDAAYAGHKAYV